MLVRVGDAEVGSVDDALDAIGRLSPGRAVAVVVSRGGDERTFSVTPD